MASQVRLKTGWQIKWKPRGGSWESEFFADHPDWTSQLEAAKFKLDVEAAGNAWPQGWVKGRGYVTAEELAAEAAEAERSKGHLLEPYGHKYIEEKFAAKRVGADEYRRQKGKVSAFVQAVPQAIALTEILADDDSLREQVLEEPTSAGHLLDTLEVEPIELCIEDVDRDMVAQWITWMRVSGQSAGTIKKHHDVLQQIGERALDEDLIGRNPFRKAQIGKVEPVRKKVVLEPSEFWLIYDCMIDKPGDCSKDFIETAVGTGLRFGEITAATVKDWDPVTGTLTVDKAWKRALKGHKVGTTKSQAGVRTVYVGEVVAAILDKHTAGKGPDDLIFTALRGGRIRQNVFGTDRWQPAVQAALAQGLPPEKAPRFHDLRHTLISWYRDHKIADAAIKDLVGHSDEAMTGKYGSVTSITMTAARQTVDSMLSRVA